MAHIDARRDAIRSMIEKLKLVPVPERPTEDAIKNSPDLLSFAVPSRCEDHLRFTMIPMPADPDTGKAETIVTLNGTGFGKVYKGMEYFRNLTKRYVQNLNQSEKMFMEGQRTVFTYDTPCDDSAGLLDSVLSCAIVAINLRYSINFQLPQPLGNWARSIVDNQIVEAIRVLDALQKFTRAVERRRQEGGEPMAQADLKMVQKAMLDVWDNSYDGLVKFGDWMISVLEDEIDRRHPLIDWSELRHSA